MFKNLKNIRKNTKEKSQELTINNDRSIKEIKDWVDNLLVTLTKHSKDKEFVMDLLESSGNNFTKSFSDLDKENVFLYILGTLAREKGIN